MNPRHPWDGGREVVPQMQHISKGLLSFGVGKVYSDQLFFSLCGVAGDSACLFFNPAHSTSGISVIPRNFSQRKTGAWLFLRAPRLVQEAFLSVHPQSFDVV